ncbi:uncharacterized protein LOC128580864 [Nycticebus coucang]|uniref:uncharacterized protein LOC128580864 n=1 Tax=Nycticebus coucang TaxID=9470 RepID=UPI00234D6617|nr:uncharacterized protein LOC128580864 [Nycticebus coucang]
MSPREQVVGLGRRPSAPPTRPRAPQDHGPEPPPLVPSAPAAAVGGQTGPGRRAVPAAPPSSRGGVSTAPPRRPRVRVPAALRHLPAGHQMRRPKLGAAAHGEGPAGEQGQGGPSNPGLPGAAAARWDPAKDPRDLLNLNYSLEPEPCEDTDEGTIQEKLGLTRLYWCVHLGLPSLQNCEK